MFLALAVLSAGTAPSIEWGLGDSQGSAGRGWQLASLHELNVNKASFIRAYNTEGLSIIHPFHASSCCIAAANGIRISVHVSGNTETGSGALFPASVADGTLKCHAADGYVRGERMRFHGLSALRADATFSAHAGCIAGAHNPGIFVRIGNTAGQIAQNDGWEFAFSSLSANLDGGWQLMSAADLTRHSAEFIKQYNENAGLAVVKPWHGDNCCIALKGGDKLVLTDVSIPGTELQFPANSDGELQCSPPAGYTTSTYSFYGHKHLPATVSFAAAPACSTSGNPSVWGRPSATAVRAAATLEFAMFDSTAAPPTAGKWTLMSAADFATHREAFIAAYNDRGGFGAIARFRSGNCCFAVAGGSQLIIEGSTLGYQFPALQSGGIVCNPEHGYSNSTKYHFYGAQSLPLNTKFGVKAGACASNRNPGMWMRTKQSMAGDVNAVNCEVGDWGSWSACSASCGGTGIRRKRRDVTRAPIRGGQPCPPTLFAMNCGWDTCPVDCSTTSWSAWSKCSVSCGMQPGSQSRSRAVTQDAQAGGASCPALTQTQECLHGPCPLHCVVSAWSTWSVCSRTCGGGSQVRARSVVNHAAHGGNVCPFLKEEQSCNEGGCPVPCKLSAFGPPGKCTKTCGGGKQVVTRSIVTPAANGGSCPTLTSEWDCATGACPVDCRLTAWGVWSACSVSCFTSDAPAKGLRARSRSVIVQPTNEGKACSPLSESEVCTALMQCPIHCHVSGWSSWSSCSKSCGLGLKHRARVVERERDHGGSVCPALHEQRSCGGDSVCPEHCEVSEWGAWTLCNARCNGGYQSRRRGITVKPNFVVDLAVICPALTESRACNQQAACPVHCRVSAWGSWSRCGETRRGVPLGPTCGMSVQTRERVVRVSPLFNGVPCPKLEQTRPCAMDSVCAVDCVVSDWGSWGECSKSCWSPSGASAVAVKWRSRVINVVAVGAGKACPVEHALHDFTLCRNLPLCDFGGAGFQAYFGPHTSVADSSSNSDTDAALSTTHSCPSGSFSTTHNASNCELCPAGRFQPQAGQSFCYYCSPDTYQPSKGSTACQHCKRGQLAPGIGNVDCAPLPKKHLQSHDSPVACSPGHYVVHDAVHDGNYCNYCCVKCPTGTYSTTFGSSACSNCTAPNVVRDGMKCEPPSVYIPPQNPATAPTPAHMPEGMPSFYARIRLKNVSRADMTGPDTSAAIRQAAVQNAFAQAINWDVKSVSIERVSSHTPVVASSHPCSRYHVSVSASAPNESGAEGQYFLDGMHGGEWSYRTNRCTNGHDGLTAYEQAAEVAVPCKELHLYWLSAQQQWCIGPTLGSPYCSLVSTEPAAVEPEGDQSVLVSNSSPLWYRSTQDAHWIAATHVSVKCWPVEETDVWLRAAVQSCSAASSAKLETLGNLLAMAIPISSTLSHYTDAAYALTFASTLRAAGLLVSSIEQISHHTKLGCQPRLELSLPVPPTTHVVPAACTYDGHRLRVHHASLSNMTHNHMSCYHRQDLPSGLWRCQCHTWAVNDFK